MTAWFNMVAHTMDEPCRWALGKELDDRARAPAPGDKSMIDLPEDEQVARGQTLLSMLQGPEDAGFPMFQNVPVNPLRAPAAAPSCPMGGAVQCPLYSRPMREESLAASMQALSMPLPPTRSVPPPPSGFQRVSGDTIRHLRKRRAAAEAAAASASRLVAPVEPPTTFDGVAHPGRQILHELFPQCHQAPSHGGHQELLELAGLVKGGCLNDEVGSEADRSSEDTASTTSSFHGASVKKGSSAAHHKLQPPPNYWYPPASAAAPGPMGGTAAHFGFMGNPMAHAAAMSAIAAGHAGVRAEGPPGPYMPMPTGPLGHIANAASARAPGVRSSAVR